MELPIRPESAIERAAIILGNVQKYSTSRHLLLMNGCDHQPVQEDIGMAIQTLNEVIPDYTFKHSNFPLYLDSLKQEGKTFQTVSGELISELTEGWATLVNTASSRMYLKQWNTRVQLELERWVEPFMAIAAQQGDEYPDAFIRYAWKMLLQNHPHDSICGCSLDEVHEEMVTRFKKAMQVAESLSKKALYSLASKIDTKSWAVKIGEAGLANSIPLVIFNPLGWDRSEWVEAELDTDGEMKWNQYKLVDSDGNNFEFDWSDLGWVRGFTLPDDKFRIAWRKRRYALRFCANNVPSLGHSTYLLRHEAGNLATGEPTDRLMDDPMPDCCICRLEDGEALLENAYLRLEVNKKGLMSVTDKLTGHSFHDLLAIEDTGDIGNEYMYMAAEQAAPIYSGNNEAVLELLSTGPLMKLGIKHKLYLPIERSGNLRSSTGEMQEVQFIVRLNSESRRVDVDVIINNRTKDHRLRVLFPSGLQTEHVYADAPFDVMKRKIEPWSGWTNPSHCERMQTFFDLTDGAKGLMIVTEGLPEYEVLRDARKTMALTLLRCVGEIGDWNYFPTPGAQCLGEFTARFSIVPHRGDYRSGLQQVYEFSAPMRIVVTGIHEGGVAPEMSWFAVKSAPSLQITSLKKASKSKGVLVRMVNLGGQTEEIQLSGELCLRASGIREVMLNEESIDSAGRIELTDNQVIVPSKRIVSVILE
jgi:alpha-mannosidase